MFLVNNEDEKNVRDDAFADEFAAVKKAADEELATLVALGPPVMTYKLGFPWQKKMKITIANRGNLTGKEFGRLVVLERNQGVYCLSQWNCLCTVCESTVIKTTKQLVDEGVQTCMESKICQLIGNNLRFKIFAKDYYHNLGIKNGEGEL